MSLFFRSQRSPGNRRARSGRRSVRGSSIAEIAPVLFILFVIVLFPMLDFLWLVYDYMAGLWLHNLILREAGVTVIVHMNGNFSTVSSVDKTCCDENNGTNKIAPMIADWQGGAAGKLAMTPAAPTFQTTVNNNEGAGRTRYVHINMSMDCNPLLSIPFFMTVPGMNAPVTFNYSGRSVIEDVRNF